MIPPRQKFIPAAAFLLLFFACANHEPAEAGGTKTGSDPIREIGSNEEFESILNNAEGRLLVFDLYADWCMPCKILTPRLSKIAAEMKEQADFYKINVDKLPTLSAAFRVQGIPFVVLVKNKTAVQAIVGLQERNVYERAIALHTDSEGEPSAATKPPGHIVDGVRVIQLDPQSEPSDMYIYRGETVRLTIDATDFPFSVHLPDFGISRQSTVGEPTELTFKADKEGVYPLFCNGDCPSGDGSRYARIIVIPFTSSGESEFMELTVTQAAELIRSTNDLLILDVRTPKEYYDAHIDGTTLIPLQELEKRTAEIASYRNKPVLVYCRSGNRSTVAAQILIDNGFSDIRHLRRGMIGWQKEKQPVVTQ